LPSYAELKAREALCRWLDMPPRQRARLPFATFATFVADDDEVHLALGGAAAVPHGCCAACAKPGSCAILLPANGCIPVRGGSVWWSCGMGSTRRSARCPLQILLLLKSTRWWQESIRGS